MRKKYTFLISIVIVCQGTWCYAGNFINQRMFLHNPQYEEVFKGKFSARLLATNISDEFNQFSEFNDIDEIGSANDQLEQELYDPFEKLNRQFFNFSLWLDNVLISKVEPVYKTIPNSIRKSIINFLNNLNEPVNIVNHFLQLKIVSFGKGVLRLSLNSTLGCFGLFDIASTLNLPYNPNDLGYTLAYYNIGNGFYIFVPILGPFTLTTGLSYLVSNYLYSDLLSSITNIEYLSVLTSLGFYGFYYLENRDSLVTFNLSSADMYSLVKSAYIQNKNYTFSHLKSTW